jgi:hypothetical protein
MIDYSSAFVVAGQCMISPVALRPDGLTGASTVCCTICDGVIMNPPPIDLGKALSTLNMKAGLRRRLIDDIR